MISQRFVAFLTATSGLILLVGAATIVAEDGPAEQLPPPPSSSTGRPSPVATSGLWLSGDELADLPTTGAGWEALEDAASSLAAYDDDDADLSERNDHNTAVLAAALRAARQDDHEGRLAVRDALADVVDESPEIFDTLAAARRLVSYVVAADLVGLDELDPEFDTTFRGWLSAIRRARSHDDGRSIVSTHEDRPNNWGTHAGASRIAAALYLDDDADLARAADVFAGWLGNRDRYTGFEYGERDWQCDPDRPVGINPSGCRIDGRDVSGVLPDDQRRGGDFEWPPPRENYVWEALQGAVVQAELLSRAGHDAWRWSDAALVRAIDWLHVQADYPAEGDDTWIPWLVADATGRDLPLSSPTTPGKNMGFTDWTHAGERTTAAGAGCAPGSGHADAGGPGC